MISVKKGKIDFSGKRIDLWSELTILMSSLVDQKVCSKEDLLVMVDTACLSDSERANKADELMKKFLADLDSMEIGDALAALQHILF